jgi:hypothetical protein
MTSIINPEDKTLGCSSRRGVITAAVEETKRLPYGEVININ